ncbi:IS3 family transposase [Fibrobacter succinogenes]|uniref:IS3 family transposase n=1 Tax=Fibrobacter succinogenes TaxID=833 RepID=UPI0026EC9F06|nr:IS3 family transposase [Fibrobacter succinogenes]
MAINELRQEFRLEDLLTLKGMARSTFFYHLHQKPDRYAEERKRIRTLHALHKGRYGYRRITAQLRNEGFKINRKTVYRLMRELGLKNVRRKCRYRSYKGEVGKTAPNRLKRNFNTKAPNRKWTTDVTQINIGADKCYLSPIFDMYNGEIVSYTILDHPDLKMVMDMLDKAYAKGYKWKRLILYSDQCWHYQHANYQASLKEHWIIQSMSRKGNCLDNAMMENFFGIMKSELLYPNTFRDMNHFKQELRKYIEYYNNDRIKLRLKGMSPVQYWTHNSILS